MKILSSRAFFRAGDQKPGPRGAVLRVPAATLAVVLLAGACGSPTPTPAPASAAPPSTPPSTAAPTEVPSASAGPTSLTWTRSGATDTTETAELAVPLDYGNAAAGSITLSISRRPAADQARRLGVLFVNPGGPGAPAVGIPRSSDLDVSIPQAILDRFDVIAWDPRGVGLSRGLSCPDRPTITKIESLDPDPRTSAVLANFRTLFDAVAAECQAVAGDILPYVAEANTARDMDAIRAALGEGRISYLGWSYGTYLGYLYATMFPTRLRAAVLDGPVDPTLDLVGRDAGQARGFERAFDHFLALCAGAKACPFHGGGDPGKAYDALIARLERSPAGSSLDAGQAVLGTISWLYGRDYPGLATALSRAEHGDGSLLRQAADGYFGGVSLGSYQATLCLDVPHPTSTDAIAAALATARRDAPRFGPLVILTDQYGCLDWPVPAPTAMPMPSRPGGLPPILIVSGRWDPATPSWGAAPLASALGTGVVLTRDGLGHTSGASATTDACLRNALVTYLVDLGVPTIGTVCRDGPAFAWP